MNGGGDGTTRGRAYHPLYDGTGIEGCVNGEEGGKDGKGGGDGGSLKSKVSDKSSSSREGLLSRASRKIRKSLSRTRQRRQVVDRRDGSVDPLSSLTSAAAATTNGNNPNDNDRTTTEGKDSSPPQIQIDVYSTYSEGLVERVQRPQQQWHHFRQQSESHQEGKNGLLILPSLGTHFDDTGLGGSGEGDDSSDSTHDASTLTTYFTPPLTDGDTGASGGSHPATSASRLWERAERYLAVSPTAVSNQEEDGRGGPYCDSNRDRNGSLLFIQEQGNSFPRHLEIQQSSSLSIGIRGNYTQTKDEEMSDQRLASKQMIQENEEVSRTLKDMSAWSGRCREQSEQLRVEDTLQNRVLAHGIANNRDDNGGSIEPDHESKPSADSINASISEKHSARLPSEHKADEGESNNIVLTELQRMKVKLSEQEEQMEGKVSVLERELRKQEKELRDMGRRDEKHTIKEADYVSQLIADLKAYKDECASYRNRILDKERELANTETVLYEERKKIFSLEAENRMLLNLADDSVCHSTDVEQARVKELAAYKEQCDKYREHVLELTRKALISEEALEATGQMASAHEVEKKSLIAQVERLSSSINEQENKNEFLHTALESEKAKTDRLEAEISTLKSMCLVAQADVVDGRHKADEDSKLTSILESENADLLQQLNGLKITMEKLQTVANRCDQIEKENNLLRKRNGDLSAKEIEMSKEVNEARSLASNTYRLQKSVSDNESYISKLHGDLSDARAVHLESLKNMRSKHSDEINALTINLMGEKESRRNAEVTRSELEDKCVSMERELADLRNADIHQRKAKDDHVMKLMQHADDLRMKNIECREEYASLKSEMLGQSHASEGIINELKNKLTHLEGANLKMSDDLATVNKELLLARESKMKEADDLIQIIRDKDCAILTLRSEFSNLDAVKANDVERLTGISRRLEQELEDVKSSNGLLKKQLYKMKHQLFDVTKSMRIEKTNLLSDVQNLIMNERVALTKQAEGMACDYGRKVESRKLEHTMRHSVAMSAVHTQKKDVECLLQAENEKNNDLEKLLRNMRTDNQDLVDIIDVACLKLSAKKKDLIDAIDGILLDQSEKAIEVRTLEADLKSSAAHILYLECEKDNLSNQRDNKEDTIKELESELDRIRHALVAQMAEHTLLTQKIEKVKKDSEYVQNQMRDAFDTDRRSQDQIVAGIMLEKEEALLCQENLRIKVEGLTDEIALRDSQLSELLTKEDETRQERDDLSAKLHDSREQIASLLDKSLNSKDHANFLMTHYMEIEDDLRRQLQLIQGENEGLGRKLMIVEKESDRLTADFCREKHALTSALESKEDSLLALEQQIEDLRKKKQESQQSIDGLHEEVNYLKQGYKELNEQYEVVCNERNEIYSKAEKLLFSLDNSTSNNDTDVMDTLKDNIQRIAADREHLSYTVGMMKSYHEANSATIEKLTTSLEEERLTNNNKLNVLRGEIDEMANEKYALNQQIKNMTSDMEELKLHSEEEIRLMELSIEAEKLVHDNATAELQTVFNSELEHHRLKATDYMEEIKELHETISNKGLQIHQLQAALKDSLNEALRLGSMVTSEQTKLLEVNHTISSFEEENFNLKLSLQQSQSAVDGIATVLSSHELEQSDLRLSLEKLVLEKQFLESQLSDKESIMMKTNNSLTHLQLKLAKAEQERDAQAKDSDAEIARLQSDIFLLNKKLQEEEECLMSHIVALKEDCGTCESNDHLYRELLSKLDDREINYSSRINSMVIYIDSLKDEIKALTEENDRLSLANEGVIADNESLAVENNMLALANEHFLSAKECDDSSAKSGASRAHRLNRTAAELETTILAIKKHHYNTVKRLQGELDDARSRLKMYRRKVKELSGLIEENAFVIESLHRKLRGKKCARDSAAKPLIMAEEIPTKNERLRSID
jgi:chromosome segregation ATPase